MKKLILSYSNTPIWILIVGLALVSISCNDDDEIDCEATELQFENLVDDFSQAFVDEDCDKIATLSDEIVTIMRKSKDCDWVKAEMDNDGYDNFEEYIDDIESEKDFVLNYFNCDILSCKSSVSQTLLDAVDQAKLQQDVAIIDEYLTNNGITAIKDPTGMRYTIEFQGSGTKPCLEYHIKVKYQGKLLSNGIQIGGSTDPVTFLLNDLILGWKIVLPKIQSGTKFTIYIPSGYAYGADSNNTIPANSNLIFEIELIK